MSVRQEATGEISYFSRKGTLQEGGADIQTMDAPWTRRVNDRGAVGATTEV